MRRIVLALLVALGVVLGASILGVLDPKSAYSNTWSNGRLVGIVRVLDKNGSGDPTRFEARATATDNAGNTHRWHWRFKLRDGQDNQKKVVLPVSCFGVERDLSVTVWYQQPILGGWLWVQSQASSTITLTRGTATGDTLIVGPLVSGGVTVTNSTSANFISYEFDFDDRHKQGPLSLPATLTPGSTSALLVPDEVNVPFSVKLKTDGGATFTFHEKVTWNGTETVALEAIPDQPSPPPTGEPGVTVRNSTNATFASWKFKFDNGDEQNSSFSPTLTPNATSSALKPLWVGVPFKVELWTAPSDGRVFTFTAKQTWHSADEAIFLDATASQAKMAKAARVDDKSTGSFDPTGEFTSP